MVENKLDPATGNVLCPECGRGAVWRDEKTGKMLTSPMQKMDIPGKVKARVHRCCGQAVLRRVFAAGVPAPGTPVGPTVSGKTNVNNDK